MALLLLSSDVVIKICDLVHVIHVPYDSMCVISMIDNVHACRLYMYTGCRVKYSCCCQVHQSPVGRGTLTVEWSFQDFHLSAVHSTPTWVIGDAGAKKQRGAYRDSDVIVAHMTPADKRLFARYSETSLLPASTA